MTKGDACQSSKTCELNQLCLADSEDEGFCYHKDCAIIDFDVKAKPTKKHHHSANHKAKHQQAEVKQTVDCTPGVKCEQTGDCELDEICDGSSDELRCVP